MILTKTPKGTYLAEDTFEDGSQILRVYSEDADYHADKEFINKCKSWSKEEFARLNSNASFKAAYHKVYDIDRVLTVIWLHIVLENSERFSNFDDIKTVLDSAVTHDKTVVAKPKKADVIVEPLPDTNLFAGVELPDNLFSVNDEPDAFAELESIEADESEPSFESVTDSLFAVQPIDEVEELTFHSEPETSEVIDAYPVDENNEMNALLGVYEEESTSINDIEEDVYDVPVEIHDDVEINEVEEEPIPVVAIVDEVKPETKRDVIFSYEGDIPKELVPTVATLIASNIRFEIQKTTKGYSLEVEI